MIVVGFFQSLVSILYSETLYASIDFGVLEWNYKGQEKLLLILRSMPVT